VVATVVVVREAEVSKAATNNNNSNNTTSNNNRVVTEATSKALDTAVKLLAVTELLPRPGTMPTLLPHGLLKDMGSTGNSRTLTLMQRELRRISALV
jgi:hypothetical protein